MKQNRMSSFTVTRLIILMQQHTLKILGKTLLQNEYQGYFEMGKGPLKFKEDDFEGKDLSEYQIGLDCLQFLTI